MSRSPEDRLLEALRRLPGARPSEDFTSELLSRLEGERRSPGFRAWRLGWVALALLAAVTLAVVWAPEAPPSEPSGLAAASAERLRRDHRRLQRDLEALRAEIRATQPVLYLGSDDHVDLYLDLESFAGPPPQGTTVPARLRESPRRVP